jgi:hypothetical protein
MPHLLLGFSPILGFKGYNLCSFSCGSCVIFLISFVFIIQLFDKFKESY